MSQFTSAFLGQVQHPINILQEYLAAFGNKCQAAILSWLDNWTKTKRKEGEPTWVWLVLFDLATELGYCKDTIFRHLQRLVEMGVIERLRAKRWATDRAWKYRIVSAQLAKYICLNENQTADISKPVRRESETSTSTVQNQDNYIGSNSSLSYAQPQAEPPAVESKEIVEKLDEPTSEEIKDVCIQLRRLSPDITINPQVKSAIRSFWHNVPAGLARVKNAIAEGWCKQPTGVFVQTLKNGAIGDKEVVVVAKEYPRPTLEQLNQLGEMGKLVYTKLNEPGYPEVVAVNTGGGVLPWWVVLGVEVA
ncbi:MAG TPA: hypothetical protein V6D09_17940 [Leptolyngbyaceae cyanobacterium]